MTLKDRQITVIVTGAILFVSIIGFRPLYWQWLSAAQGLILIYFAYTVWRANRGVIGGSGDNR